MTIPTRGLTSTELSIAKAARRLMRRRENTVNPHQRMVDALAALADAKRVNEWLDTLPVVTTEELLDLLSTDQPT